MTKKRNIISVSILIIVWILFITTVKSAQDDLYAENTERNDSNFFLFAIGTLVNV